MTFSLDNNFTPNFIVFKLSTYADFTNIKSYLHYINFKHSFYFSCTTVYNNHSCCLKKKERHSLLTAKHRYFLLAILFTSDSLKLFIFYCQSLSMRQKEFFKLHKSFFTLGNSNQNKLKNKLFLLQIAFLLFKFLHYSLFPFILSGAVFLSCPKN